MGEDFVYLGELGEEFGQEGSFFKKWVIKQGVSPHKRRNPHRGNQLALAVTEEEAVLLRQAREAQGYGKNIPIATSDVGVFYIIQLVPELDPHRVKFGFADNVEGRLAQHKTAAPTARILNTWPCNRSWEVVAIDCLSACRCSLIANEVFDCRDVEALIERASQLFALLPNPQSRPELSRYSPYRVGGVDGDANR